MTDPSAVTPYWALTLAYWFHMLATVIWIGGLSLLVLFILPAAQSNLKSGEYAELIGKIQSRLDSVGWLSLVMLGGTGLIQMSANPNYQGFLAISNRWSAVILIKHLVFLGMIIVSVYLTWGIIPAQRRAALLEASGQVSLQAGRLHRRAMWLLRLNLFFGVLVLGLTAMARAS
jgi:uncharacterized membrane protein